MRSLAAWNIVHAIVSSHMDISVHKLIASNTRKRSRRSSFISSPLFPETAQKTRRLYLRQPNRSLLYCLIPGVSSPWGECSAASGCTPLFYQSHNSIYVAIIIEWPGVIWNAKFGQGFLLHGQFWE